MSSHAGQAPARTNTDAVALEGALAGLEPGQTVAFAEPGALLHPAVAGQEFGPAAAISTLIFLIVAVVTFIQIRATKIVEDDKN